MRRECLVGHIGTMWTLVVLCLVSTVISENVESRKSLYPIDPTLNASPLSLSVNNVPDQRPATFESAQTAQIQNTLHTTPYADVSPPDLSKYIANTSAPVQTGSALNLNNNAPENLAVAKLASYIMNLPSNLPSNGVADLSRYSAILPATNKSLLLHTQNSGNGLLQSILAIPYVQPQKRVNCVNSEVLIKIWMILSNLLKSNAVPANTNMEQIKYALILIKKYLQDTGQNNELMRRLVLLENELDKSPGPIFDSQRSFNINQPTLPIQYGNVPKLRFQYEIPPNLNAKCQEAFMKLIHWAQEAYRNLIRGQCGSVAVDSSVGYQGDIKPVPAPYNPGSNSYLQLPFAYQFLSRNPQNTAPYFYAQTPGISYPTAYQKLHNSGINAIIQLENTSPTISQPNQVRHNRALNSFAQTPSSLYNPLANLLNQNPYQSVYQKFDVKNPVNDVLGQDKNLVNINPSLVQPPPNLFQRDGPHNPSYPTLSPQVTDATVTGGKILNPELSFQGNFATNLQRLTGKIFTDNLQQHVNPVAYTRLPIIPPNKRKYDAMEISRAVNAVNVQPGQQLDAGEIQQLMHNIPASNGFYENIQKYLNSQSQYNWNTPQQYGTYSQLSYKSFPYANNIYQPLRNIKEQYDATGNNMYSSNQNVYKSLSSQRALPIIDWNVIANESKLNSGTTPTGEVELTYALRNPRPDHLQPLYFVKYRLPYDIFMQNVKSLLSTRSVKSDLFNDLVLKSNASEVPQDLASYPKEEVKDLVVREGDLIKAKYIAVNSSNDKNSSAAESINALLNKAINPDGNVNAQSDVTRPVAINNAANPYEYRASPTAILQNPVNTYQQGQGLYRNAQPLQQAPNNLAGRISSYNSVIPSV